MDVKRKLTLGVVLIASAIKVYAVEPVPVDLAGRLSEADIVRDSTVIQVTCIKSLKSLCGRFLYRFAVNEVLRGRDLSGDYTLISGDRMLAGQRYLHYRQSDTNSDGFVLVSSQPLFDGIKWVEKEWLIIPSGVSAKRFKETKVPSSSCYVSMGRLPEFVRLCSFSGVVEYDLVKRSINSSAKAER